MIFCQLFYCLLVSLSLHAGVSVILQYVLFFHLEGPHALLSKPLLVLELFVLPLQELVGLRGFRKFIVDKLVFSSECLYILRELSSLGGLDLDDLILVFNLFSEILVFLSQKFDLVLALKEAPLEVVLLARDHRNLVLHISEIEHLFLKPLLAGHQLLSFGIKVLLHLVKGGVKASNGALEVQDFLILREEIALVVCNIILKNRVVRSFVSLVLGGSLETLNELLFVLVKVFDQRLQSLYL